MSEQSIRNLPLNKVITLCGSTKFFKEFDEVALKLTLKGFLVFSIGSHRIDDSHIVGIENKKALLDKTHREKIDISNSIFVIDVDGYIGKSTQDEIIYAEYHNKNIYFLSQTDPSEIGEYT